MFTEEEKKEDFPYENAEALIAKVLEEVRSIGNPEVLNACRSLFRSRVPFHLRSYAAAALILRDLGVPAERGPGSQSGTPQSGAPRDGNGKDRKKRQPFVSGKTGFNDRKRSASETSGESPRLKKCLYAGEGTTLFFSMGRRQRFSAQNLLRVLSDVSGIEEPDVGVIRTFDNYSFVNVHPSAADLIIQDVNGKTFKGRKLVVNRARPRKEEPKPGAAGPSDEEPRLD